MRRLAELALVAIAAVWGLTFVMVQDAIEELPPMAFLAYRFVPAGLLVAIFARRALRSLGPDGWRAGLVMGAFLTAGYVFQTLGLEHTSASNAGFITGLFVVLTPLFGLLIFRIPVGPVAWAAAGLSAFGLFLLSGAGGDASLRGDGLVFGCACAFAVHILVTERAVRRYDVGALVAVQLTFCGVVCLVVARLAGRPGGAERRNRVERVAGDFAARERARLHRPELRAAHHLVGAHGVDPRRRACVCGALRLLAAGRQAVRGGLDRRGTHPCGDRRSRRGAAPAAAAAAAGGVTSPGGCAQVHGTRTSASDRSHKQVTSLLTLVHGG